MAKTYRRFIRVRGKLISSPRFSTKDAAEKWLTRMRDRKGLAKVGVEADAHDDEIPTLLEFAGTALRDRIAEYPANTWKGDERRLRVHILPHLGNFKLNLLTPAKLERFLNTFTVTKTVGGEQVKVKPAANTRRLVKATLSFVFEMALDESPRPIQVNPVKMIRSKRGPRRKKTERALPKSYLTEEQVMAFILAAKEFGGNRAHLQFARDRALAYAGLLVMIMPRKEEAIALRWRDVNFKTKTITFSWIYEQESRSLHERTKKGEDEQRPVPMPDGAIAILKHWREKSPHSGPNDFVLCTPAGGHMCPETILQMHKRLCKRAGVTVNIHGLRHSGARLFAIRSGNIKVLQEMLGHSSIQTTEIYSKLDGSHLSGFRNVLDIDVKSIQKPVKRHRNDTSKTTRRGK